MPISQKTILTLELGLIVIVCELAENDTERTRTLNCQIIDTENAFAQAFYSFNDENSNKVNVNASFLPLLITSLR